MFSLRTIFASFVTAALVTGCFTPEETLPERERREEYRPPVTFEAPGLMAEALQLARTLPARSSSGIVWDAVGPHVVGGRTRGLAVDVDDSNVLLAGGVTDGVWRSTDRGASWTRVSAADAFRSVTHLVQDPRPEHRHVWYHGTGEQHGLFNYAGTELAGGGIYKSVDRGLTWHVLPSTTTSVGFSRIFRVAVDPSNLDEDEVYAAGEGVIYRSSDGGESWTAVLGEPYETAPGERTRRETDVAVSATGMVFATIGPVVDDQPRVDKGLWQSADGITWTEITPDGWPPTQGWTVIGLDPSRPQIAYFFGWGVDAGFVMLFFRYTAPADLRTVGEWEDLTHRIQDHIRMHPGYDQIVAVKPDDPNVVYVGGIGMVRTDDAFATEQRVRRVETNAANTVEYPTLHRDRPSEPGESVWLHVDQHAIVFDPSNPDRIYVGNDGGVYTATNAEASEGRWTTLNRGYVTTQFYSIALDHTAAGTRQLLGGTQDNGTWHYDPDTRGAIWRNVTGADGFWATFANRTLRYYTTGQGGRLTRVEINRDNRYGSLESIRPVDIFPLDDTKILLDPSDERIMYLTGADREELFSGVEPTVEYVWRNNNIEETTRFSPMDFIDRLDATRVEAIITALAVASHNPRHRVYYGTGGIHQRTRGRIYRLDEAHSGEPVPVDVTGTNFPSGAVSSITVDPNDGSRVFATFSDYGVPSVFASTDAGATWTDVTGNLIQERDGMNVGLSVQWLEPVYFRGDSLYLAGTTTGLFSTRRLAGAATVWEMEGRDAIGLARIAMIDARPSDGYIAVATHGSGVYTGFATGGATSAETPVASVRTALHPNYPNPFGEETTLAFSLAAAGGVRLTLHDMQGREVAVVADRVFTAGRHEIRWAPAFVASGSYVLRLESRGQTTSRVVTIAR